MPITYAGIELTPPAFALAEVERWWHVHRVAEFDHPAHLTAGIDHLPLPPVPSPHPPRVGVLEWPTGASRWATCHLMATGSQLSRLPTSTAAADLVLSDGATSVTAPMFRLAARPISQRGDSRELYLITLVDERYYWWASGSGAAPSSPASWSALLEDLFTAVGVASPTIDTVDADYGTPDATRWDVGYQPLPLLIDAAAKTCGLRVVRSLAGDVSCVTYATASASDESQWQTHRYEVLGGGRATASEIARTVPASVGVVFPGSSPSVTTKTLASLSLTEYAGATGVADRVGTVHADLDAGGDSGDIADYATIAATDYYLWQLSRTDATMRGVRAWTPTGLESCVEWAFGLQDIVTRVLRRPLNDCEQWGKQPVSAGTDGVTASYSTVTGPNYAITADNTWEDTGVSLSLPGAGTYLLQFWTNCLATVSSLLGQDIRTRFYDTTGTPTALTDSTTVGFSPTIASRQFTHNFSMFTVYTVAAAATVKVYAYRTSSDWTQSVIGNGGTNLTGIGYVKLS